MFIRPSVRRRLEACVHQAGVLPCYLACASPVRKKFRGAAGSIDHSLRFRSNRTLAAWRVVHRSYFGAFPNACLRVIPHEQQLCQKSHYCNRSIHMHWQTAPGLNLQVMATTTLEWTICVNAIRDLGYCTQTWGHSHKCIADTLLPAAAAPRLHPGYRRKYGQNGLERPRSCRSRIS
jgi:hypothetical protein